ncbi:MAG TPA: hypothetical protein VFA75_03505 [Nevskia sp.]|nr:hypothetical protein [Nevskia sp.]
MTMTVEQFVGSYTPGPDTAIAFAWNGKHAAEFSDANDTFRSEVAAYCLSHPERPSAPLLADLLIADAKWSAQAWSVPNRFPDLAALFLVMAGPAALPVFRTCVFASFDVYGACHQMRLPADALQSLLTAVNEQITASSDESEKKQLQSLAELFTGIAAGTAAKDWVRVGRGSSEAPPVKHNLSFWGWLRSLFRQRHA